MKKKVIFLSPNTQEALAFKNKFPEFEVQHFANATHFLTWMSKKEKFDAIFNAANPTSPLGLNLIKSIKKEMLVEAPVFWITDTSFSLPLQHLLSEAGVADFFDSRVDKEKVLTRLQYLSGQKPMPVGQPASQLYSYKVPVGKRIFDILVSASALIVLLPFFIIIALIIKFESKGPAFYYSYRVGTGYKIFKFWKFRSMRQNADKMLSAMKDLNQYQASSNTGSNTETVQEFTLCATCAAAGSECQKKLIDGKGKIICEKQHIEAKKLQSGPAFIKIVNDPRITKFGNFIRNTSIDELPQLYNVLRGDMSIIGNRPLPLYEAEKITTDQFAARFIAPAGITGLWQVSKRGKGNMSEEERKALDIEYATNYSLKKDLKIILKTIPALFQKENV